MSIGNSIGESIGASIGSSIGEEGLVSDFLARFDETTILGTNPVTEWRNNGRGASPFDLDTVVGTAANLTTLDTGVALLTGTAGDFFSTPDSVAASITGDLELIVEVAMDDWTPAALSVFIAKDTTGQRSYLLFMNTNGTLSLGVSTDGAALIQKTSTAATGFANGTKNFVKVTLDVDNGAAGFDVTFFTSSDGITFAQLGDVVTTAGAITLADTTAIVEVGSNNVGTANRLAGRITRAQIFDGIDGTLAVDFQPSKATVNTATFVSDTGETWTANGDAFVNATGHTGIYSRGSVGLETTASQLITTASTVFAVFKPTLTAPGANQAVFDARSDNTKRRAIYTRDLSADKYVLFQGGAEVILSEAYDNKLRILTGQFNGDATSKLTASDVGSVIGDAGAVDWDFGSVFVRENGTTESVGLFLEFIIYDRALSDAEIAKNQTFLEAKYGT